MKYNLILSFIILICSINNVISNNLKGNIIVNSYSNNNDNDDKILEVTCLGKYTGVFHSFIYFAKNETSTDYYVIRTAWLVTYPNRIKKELKNNNLYVFDKNPTDNCDWTLRTKMTNVGIYTGYVYSRNEIDKNLSLISTTILNTLYPSIEILIICLIIFLIVLPISIICIYLYYNLGNNQSNYRG